MQRADAFLDQIRVCGVRRCFGKHHARGYCDKHYRRWLRHGDPSVTLRRDIYEQAQQELAEMEWRRTNG